MNLKRSQKMNKRFGVFLILAMGVILLLYYSLIRFQPKKQSTRSFMNNQSAYAFFNNHPSDTSLEKESQQIKKSNMKVKGVPKLLEKGHLIHVEGLDDLYDMRNLTKEELKAFLVWGKMRSLVSRSDALPETFQGVKEASAAWKELVLTIEKEKDSKDGKDNQDVPNCPYSVSTFDEKVLSSGNILEFPCGMVVDSSITIVGIPDRNQQSFQIELIGSKFAEEPEHPIVLFYNVSVPGENITEEPFVAQNTWTIEFGWGKPERCPSDSSSGTGKKVDQLVLCNGHVVRSIEAENLTVTHPTSNTSANLSPGRIHGTTNFPFTEGNPFTATLWAGLEGFHMTVNGRHETSFAYREKLEPWSVDAVKVSGGVKVLSALANALPVTEDSDIVDVEHLKVPLVSGKRLVLLIGVFSTGNNFERRMALRRSWMQYKAVRSGEVAVRFFIGLHKNNRVNYELWSEAQAYGDIQLMPFVDYYSLITLKTVAICIMGTKIIPAKYIMKTDDDAFVRVDEVLSSLRGKSSEALLYGLISFKASPQRDKDSKWYISEKEWPHSTYPPWAHGPGYVISRDIAKYIVRSHHDRQLQLFKLEDVAVGIWIDQYKNSGNTVRYTNDDRFHNAGCDSNYVLAHYQSPRMVLCLWQKLQKEKQPICCE